MLAIFTLYSLNYTYYTMSYYLKKNQQQQVAQNLIDVFEKDIDLIYEASLFIINWVMSGPKEKQKFYYDVWDIVLKNHIPKQRPILFRSTQRKYKKNRISSFTSSLYCAERFSEDKGYLIICDTEESLEHEKLIRKKGHYKNSFYPIVELLKKAKSKGGWHFSERFLNEYTKEKEYVMYTNFDNMPMFKFCKSKIL